MATDDQAQGAENEEIEDRPVEGAENEGGQEGGDEGEDPYAPLAQKLGWVPKDQFQGDPETWKPAEQFIIDGRDIQRETSRELKTVRAQLDTIARTSASIVEQQVREKVDELSLRYQKAVDDGDPKKAFELAGEIQDLSTRVSTPQGPSPVAQEWAGRNETWFRKPGNELATARAIEVTNVLAKQGVTDEAYQPRIAEQTVRKEFPELFANQRNGKQPPGVNQPGSRTSGVSNRPKGFSDMPKAAQDIARDMADRKVIKSVEDYAKNYFANVEAKG